MPLPKPKEDENKKQFIRRCMGDEQANEEFPETEQRTAYCFAAWEDKEESNNMPKELTLNGFVGDDLTVAKVNELLEDVKGEDIIIHLNTIGGYVYEGIEIYNVIKRFAGKKTVILGALVASIGTYITAAFDEVIAQDSTVFYMHNAQSFAIGDYRVFEKEAREMKRLNKHLAERLAKRTNKTVKELIAMMDEETFLYGQELVDEGFADKLQEENEDTEPKEIAIKKAANLHDRYLRRVAAMGIGTRKNVVTPYVETAKMIEEEWSASASENRWREHVGVEGNEDLPSDKYAKRFAWHDSDDATNFGAYKLPYWDYRNGDEVVNIRAVRNIKARLPQTEGIPADEKQQIESIMDKYLNRWDEMEAEDSISIGGDMNKEELLKKLNSMIKAGEASVSEIANVIGITQPDTEAKNAMKVVNQLKELGYENPVEDVKNALKDQVLTKEFGAATEDNTPREYAERLYNAGVKVEEIKEDKLFKKLKQEQADYNSQSNTLENVGDDSAQESTGIRIDRV